MRVGHYYLLRKSNHDISALLMDYDTSDEFEIKTLCFLYRKDYAKKTKALETFFIL